MLEKIKQILTVEAPPPVSKAELQRQLSDVLDVDQNAMRHIHKKDARLEVLKNKHEMEMGELLRPSRQATEADIQGLRAKHQAELEAFSFDISKTIGLRSDLWQQITALKAQIAGVEAANVPQALTDEYGKKERVKTRLNRELDELRSERNIHIRKHAKLHEGGPAFNNMSCAEHDRVLAKLLEPVTELDWKIEKKQQEIIQVDNELSILREKIEGYKAQAR